jgi:hypothetical protein
VRTTASFEAEHQSTTDDNEITGHTNLGLLLEGTAPPRLTVTDNSDDAGFFATNISALNLNGMITPPMTTR